MQLYFNDFGLTLSNQFDLTPHEREFFRRHQTYDFARASVALVHATIVGSFQQKNTLPQTNWKDLLRLYGEGQLNVTSPIVERVLTRYGPLVKVFLDFAEDLKTKSKETPYPSEQISSLIPSK